MGYIQFTFQEATFCFLLLGIGPDSSQKQNSGSIEEELELGLELEMEVRMSGIGSCSLVAEAVWKEIESTRTLTEHHLSTLHFIFGKNFEGASRIVDQRGVNRIEAHPSRRFIFQVRAESRRKEQYLCFPDNFCACYSFFYDVVNRAEQLCCKHQLAARLAASLGADVEVNVSDEDLALLLSKI